MSNSLQYTSMTCLVIAFSFCYRQYRIVPGRDCAKCDHARNCHILKRHKEQTYLLLMTHNLKIPISQEARHTTNLFLFDIQIHDGVCDRVW
jgi:hypothetical protein